MYQWIQKNLVAFVALVAYGVMAFMIFEQTRVIESQKTLIRQLFQDSAELNALKMRELAHRKSLKNR